MNLCCAEYKNERRPTVHFAAGAARRHQRLADTANQADRQASFCSFATVSRRSRRVPSGEYLSPWTTLRTSSPLGPGAISRPVSATSIRHCSSANRRASRTASPSATGRCSGQPSVLEQSAIQPVRLTSSAATTGLHPFPPESGRFRADRSPRAREARRLPRRRLRPRRSFDRAQSEAHRDESAFARSHLNVRHAHAAGCERGQRTRAVNVGGHRAVAAFYVRERTTAIMQRRARVIIAIARCGRRPCCLVAAAIRTRAATNRAADRERQLGVVAERRYPRSTSCRTCDTPGRLCIRESRRRR